MIEAFGHAMPLSESLYFSVVTIATVGYGDIVPKSVDARLLVSLEILVGVFYQIFFFSILATILLQRRNDERP